MYVAFEKQFARPVESARQHRSTWPVAGLDQPLGHGVSQYWPGAVHNPTQGGSLNAHDKPVPKQHGSLELRAGS
jgi:hypothetical protein